MTVKDIFQLRQQGRIEEAYEAIRPLYAVHRGKYTTLCMFWTASDVLKKRLAEQRIDEAEKIFKALLRVLPNIEDSEGNARRSLLYAALMLDRKSPTFSMLDFVAQLAAAQLSDADWAPTETTPPGAWPPQFIPSLAQQLLERAFQELEHEPTPDNALKVMPMLQEAVRRNPREKANQHYIDVVNRIIAEYKT